MQNEMGDAKCSERLIGGGAVLKIRYSVTHVRRGGRGGQWRDIPEIADIGDGKIAGGDTSRLMKISDDGVGWYVHDYDTNETMSYQAPGAKLWRVFGRLVVVKGHSDAARCFLFEDLMTGRRIGEFPVWGGIADMPLIGVSAAPWLNEYRSLSACLRCRPAPPTPGRCQILADRYLSVTTARGAMIYDYVRGRQDGWDFALVARIAGVVVNVEHSRIWIVRMNAGGYAYFDSILMRVFLRVGDIREWIEPDVAVEYNAARRELTFRRFDAAAVDGAADGAADGAVDGAVDMP